MVADAFSSIKNIRERSRATGEAEAGGKKTHRGPHNREAGTWVGGGCLPTEPSAVHGHARRPRAQHVPRRRSTGVRGTNGVCGGERRPPTPTFRMTAASRGKLGVCVFVCVRVYQLTNIFLYGSARWAVSLWAPCCSPSAINLFFLFSSRFSFLFFLAFGESFGSRPSTMQ